MIFVLDSNILQRDFSLRSSLFQALVHYLDVTKSTIVMPQLVVDETVANYRRELRSRLKTLARDRGHIAAIYLGDLPEAPPIDADEEAEKFRQHLLRAARVNPSDIVPYDPSKLNEIITRAINRIPPCTERGEEIRDCLLWLTVKDMARQHAQDGLALISGDSAHFADKEGHLAASLLDEVEAESLPIRFFPSLEQFLKEHASKIDFITTAWLVEQVPPDYLLSTVAEKLEQSLALKLPTSLVDGKRYTGSVSITGGGIDLREFFVNELPDGSFRVEASYNGEVEFELEAAVTRTGSSPLISGSSSSDAQYPVWPTAFSSGILFRTGTEYTHDYVMPEVELMAELIVREANVRNSEVIDFAVSSPWRWSAG